MDKNAVNKKANLHYDNRDFKQAEKYYLEAASQNCEKSMYRLYCTYIEGKKGVRKDTETAIKWLFKAVEKGYAPAQCNLGEEYLLGGNLTKNSEKALECFHKAAKQGDAGAQFNLGCIYDEGQIVPPDYAQAVKWYTLAVEQGYDLAFNNLSLIYREGRPNVLKNLEKSKELSAKGAKLGDKLARRNLNMTNWKSQLIPYLLLGLIVISPYLVVLFGTDIIHDLWADGAYYASVPAFLLAIAPLAGFVAVAYIIIRALNLLIHTFTFMFYFFFVCGILNIIQTITIFKCKAQLYGGDG
ncbi:MAG: sel1 repeat family protein [Treponema sp.]|nr:sel1 repeat family protein [Treponema sp.]